MIIWIGEYNGSLFYRHLGHNGCVNPMLTHVNISIKDTYLLSHNEGTDATDCTTPTIGYGSAKLCRDMSMSGYCVGTSVEDDTKLPFLIDYQKNHIMCYDIESEFAGKSGCNHNSPILCVGLVCSCGWSRSVTRAKPMKDQVVSVIRDDNRSIAEAVMELILDHKPIFTLGHNVYSFDNKVLAIALGSKHPMSKYFRQILRSDASTVTDFGLIMDIPGINNLDTYRFIRQSMFGTYKTFSLGALCESNGIRSPKLLSTTLVFSELWYKDNAVNTMDMMRYNIADCRANLQLCEKLDLINEIISLSYIAKAWISDVLLYNTGAMATSCLCASALKDDYTFAWSRCDWRPENFKGGEVLYTGPCVASNLMIVDFISMYPSIMSSCSISPECVDYVLPSIDQTPRFVKLGALACHLSYLDNKTTVCCLYGIRDIQDSMGCKQVIIGEIIAPGILDSKAILSRVSGLVSRDVTLRYLDVTLAMMQPKPHTTVQSSTLHVDRRLANLVQQCKASIVVSAERTLEHQWFWTPKFTENAGYAIDWISTFDGHTTIVRAPEYEAHFTHGPRVASSACRDLMSTRKVYKKLMKQTRNKDQVQSKVYDKIQYALKISANSMYGALSFPQYNTYSPRCGMSTTAIGRWALNVTATIICCLGLAVVYGDTDSIMFCLNNDNEFDHKNPLKVHYASPMKGYLDSIRQDPLLKHEAILCEYLSNSKGSQVLDTNSSLNHLHNSWLRGIIPKIVNIIMSYTCVCDLVIEHQETGAKLRFDIESCVFKRFLIMQKKHYIGLVDTDSTYSKGVSYVRRSGAMLKDEALKLFSNAVLKSKNRDEALRLMTLYYKRLCRCITSASPIKLFYLQLTLQGVSGMYVKVKHPNFTYMKLSEFQSKFYELDSDYYKNILVRVLDTVCRSIGLEDSNYIITSIGHTIHGV
mmetsp:Transcript_2713/g.7222  ORF Transcript_2713/g.7222 Transcript_2713/m.7222 type:complete len:926 (+) Transcript_2713:17548-20325(+)